MPEQPIPPTRRTARIAAAVLLEARRQAPPLVPRRAKGDRARRRDAAEGPPLPGRRRRLKKGSDMLQRLAWAFVLSAALASPAPATTFTVDSTGDTSDTDTTDGVCIASGGGCTLRAAIEQANAHSGADTITFAIANAGVQTIRPDTNLPQ